jgi:hypothetical protein
MESGVSWGDVACGILPTREVSEPDADGVRTVVFYRTKDGGTEKVRGWVEGGTGTGAETAAWLHPALGVPRRFPTTRVCRRQAASPVQHLTFSIFAVARMLCDVAWRGVALECADFGVCVRALARPRRRKFGSRHRGRARSCVGRPGSVGAALVRGVCVCVPVHIFVLCAFACACGCVRGSFR